MEIFRINKTGGFTVMSNYHLQDPSLSLKAIGLLSKLLSLPENWDLTLKGLAKISKDGIDSIQTGLKELEMHGYISRKRVRNEKGEIEGIEYSVFERPDMNENFDPEKLKAEKTKSAKTKKVKKEASDENKTSDDEKMSTRAKSENAGNKEKPKTPDIKADSPYRENPDMDEKVTDSPHLDYPHRDFPHVENPDQINTKEINTTLPELNLISSYHRVYNNTDKEERIDAMGYDEAEKAENQVKSDLSENSAFSDKSSAEPVSADSNDELHLKLTTARKNTSGAISIPSSSLKNFADEEILLEEVKSQFEYDWLLHTENADVEKDELDALVELTAEVLASTCKTMRIAGQEHTLQKVKKRLRMLTSEHIVYILQSMHSNTTKIKNIKKYLLAALYNAPVTMGSFYAAEVSRQVING